ncbi:MAG: TonB-dependent receptor [Tannerellaceae bacterium]|nr:TonB-dependent receptor [Tannerellaceae bacterium]
MKIQKYICCLLMLFVGVGIMSAQQLVTLTVREAPAVEVFTRIEEQTGLRIYCHPADTDSLFFTVHADKEEPESLLNRILEPDEMQVFRYQDKLFITTAQLFLVALPEGYFAREKERETTEDTTGYDLSLLTLSRRNQKATSENKVYEIGDADKAVTSGRVTLNGRITDFKTGEPVAGIALFVKNPLIGTTTDAYGYYTIRLPAGRNELFIQGMGTKDTRRHLFLHTDGKLDIELEEQIFALREVTVSSEKLENVRSLGLGVERLKIKDIKNIPTAFGELDILLVVMSLPGVKSVGEMSSGFNIRGGPTDQNLILFNDGTIYNPTHMFGLFSAFNPDLVKDIELYKSSIPSRYGGRISSVLDINSREGNKKEFKGSASLGLLTSSLTLEGPVFNDKTSFIVGGRTTYSDWLLKKLPEKTDYRDGNAGFYDLNLTVNHKFDEYNSLYVNGYFSRDRFRFDEFERYSYQNTNASVKWRHIFNPLLTGIFTAGYDHYDYRTVSTEVPEDAYHLSFDINQVFGKADFTWYIHPDHTIDWGINLLHYNLNPGKYLPEGSESLVVADYMQKEKALEYALYAGEKWDITHAFSVTAGIRYSIFGAIGPRDFNLYAGQYLPSLFTITETKTESGGVFKTWHGPEFRISGRYEFANDFSIKAGYNTMRQYIHKLSNTTIMSPTDTWKLSDANIRPQTGSQFAVGIYKNFLNNTLETFIEGYYKTMDNYLDYRSGAELLMNHHIETDVLETKGKAYGIEVMAKKTVGKLNGWVSYTYSRTHLRQKDPRITEPVNNGNWYPADYDKPHEVKLVGNYKFTHRYSFSVNCDYSTGRPVTLPVSKYKYAGGEFVYYSGRNEYRIPDFFRMDASFNIEPSHHLTLLTHSTVSIGIYNLTGRKNAYSVYYISEEGQMKGYKLAIFGAPIPFISYNIKF